ncbi:hypothetical protein POM88_028862 [Heracleum sosnowskyi]|uniref:Uncharacterized protein n=1 Tax=Heracleum sosnowskyi TaxID=360622 RepID=A0AAD8HSL0_9APIA|nr:hypothetical protein POM88_028862 [Heracleum sosnowskyi]
MSSSLIRSKVNSVAEEMGIRFLGMGFQPKWGMKDIPLMPKVNLDFSSEADMVRKFWASLALHPHHFTEEVEVKVNKKVQEVDAQVNKKVQEKLILGSFVRPSRLTMKMVIL